MIECVCGGGKGDSEEEGEGEGEGEEERERERKREWRECADRADQVGNVERPHRIPQATARGAARPPQPSRTGNSPDPCPFPGMRMSESRSLGVESGHGRVASRLDALDARDLEAVGSAP